MFLKTMDSVKGVKYLEPDDRWAAYGVKSHQDFIAKYVPDIWLNPKVNTDVIEAFETVNYLMVYGYYRYQFFDMAYNRTLQILEMASKLRYHELTGTLWPRKKSLKDLLDTLSGMNMFDSHIDAIQSIRNSRNWEVHPERHSFSGNVFVNRIHHVVQIINEMYEDVGLRIQRKALSEDLGRFVAEHLTGNVEIIRGTKHTTMHSLLYGLIDNKGSEIIYHLYAVPMFSLTPYKLANGGGVPVAKLFLLELTGVTFSAGRIKGFERRSRTELTIQKVLDATRLKKCEDWNRDYKPLDIRYLIEHGWQRHVGMLHFELLQDFTKRM